MRALTRAGSTLSRLGPTLGASALGALVVHHLAYTVSQFAGWGSVTTDHAHLSTLWAVATPVTVIAGVVFVLRQLRGLGLQPGQSSGWMAGTMAGVFLLQESIEYVLAGRDLAELALSPAIGLGVLFALPVALAFSRLLHTAVEVVAAILTPAPHRPTGIRTVHSSFINGPHPALVVVDTPPRGPPRRLR